MFSKIKSWLTIASLIVAVLAGSFGLIERAQKIKERKRADNNADIITVQTTEVTKYKNKLGQEVTKTIQYERVIQDLGTSYDSLERDLAKTIEASKLREKDIKEAYVVALNTTTSGRYDSIVRDTLQTVSSIPCNDIRYFDNGFYDIVSYPDSMTIVNNEIITVLKAARRVPRKIQPLRWAGWEWKKKIDKNVIELQSNNPNSNLNGRFIKF